MRAAGADDGGIAAMTDATSRALRWFLLAILFTLSISALAQGPVKTCAVTYRDRNMIDYGPLVFRNLSGYAIDPSSVRMAGGCIGLFTENDHRLVATAQPDESGNFAFAKVAPGRYKLVADFPGFCAANVPLKIVRWPRGRAKLVVHMKPGAIDVCSYGDYK